MLFVGVDWSETYYDLCLLNHDGRVLAVLRIGGGLAGVGALHALVTPILRTRHMSQSGLRPIGGPTGPGVVDGRLAGVCGQPAAVSRYRGRHGTSRTKSDAVTPRCWPGPPEPNLDPAASMSIHCAAGAASVLPGRGGRPGHPTRRARGPGRTGAGAAAGVGPPTRAAVRRR
jgi:hypothetical protein